MSFLLRCFIGYGDVPLKTLENLNVTKSYLFESNCSFTAVVSG